MKVSKPVLFVFLLALAASIYILTSGEKKKPMKTQPTGTEVTIPLPLSTPRYERLEKKRIEVAWSRDPFLLPFDLKKQTVEGETAKPRPEVTLHAIVEGKRGRMAILGDEIVSKGDIIKTGERVAEIGEESIVLESGGVRRVIILRQAKGGE